MKYLSKLIGERSTADGVVLITLCGSFLLLGGLAKVAAWAGLAYGIFTLFKTES
jgi:hypothetical protein